MVVHLKELYSLLLVKSITLTILTQSQLSLAETPQTTAGLCMVDIDVIKKQCLMIHLYILDAKRRTLAKSNCVKYSDLGM